MSEIAAADLLPRPPGGQRPGLALALVVHAGLIAALAAGVDWRTRAPTVVSAELWSAVPQTAAPRPPAPIVAPPPPAPPPVAAAPPPKPLPKPAVAEPDAQITIEKAARERAEREQALREKAAQDKAEREKAERQKLAHEKAARLQAEREQDRREKAELAAKEKAQLAAEESRLAKVREEYLKRLQSQADSAGAGGRGSAAQDAAPSAGYASRLIAHIKPNIVLTETLPSTLEADVEVRAVPGGGIIARRIVKSSGNAMWDDAVLRAIDRTGNLPRDVDGRVPGTLVITFRP